MSSRSRPFFLSLGTVTGEKVPVTINGEPVEFDAPGFKGRFHVIHDTGNEPGNVKPEQTGGPRKGLMVQFQGKFKKIASMGQENSTNIWAGGTLDGELNLGWIMSNVASVGAKFAKKKTGGRFVIDLGTKTSPCFMGFHIRALMCFNRTPEGEEPPKLGSDEVENIAWAGPGLLEVDTTSTYTFVWRVAYLDLCTWELLKVPAISPLPLESVLGDIKSGIACIYDLGHCGGDHSKFRESLILEIFFARGSEGDEWPQPALLPPEMDDSPKTPLEAASDASEEASQPDPEAEGLVVEDENSDSDSTQDSLEDDAFDQDEEEIRALSKSHSQALLEIETWRPRSMDGPAANINVEMPFYIEAIDRFRRRKVRYWYIFGILSDAQKPLWHARDSLELASLCRPKRRLRTFRRGPGARRYTCCAVKTLEQFRMVVLDHLKQEDSKLRNVLLRAAESGTLTPEMVDKQTSGVPTPEASSSQMSPARLARKVRKGAMGLRRRRWPSIAPRFFMASDSVICALAFAHARQGRGKIVQEALVGAVHFEGRLCEELLRLSSDGILRCFTPYDCEKPRVSVHVSEIQQVDSVPGLFLGRFLLWQVHTVLRVFVFCCADGADRELWISNLQQVMSQFHDSSQLLTPAETKQQIDSPREPMTPKTPATWKSSRSTPADVFGSIAKKAAVKVAGGASKGMASLRAIASGQRVPSKEAILLMDSTRARRWGHRRRLVLNDRILTSAPKQAFESDIAQVLLETALSLGDVPAAGDVASFLDATCLLKAIQFASWSEAEQLAFWVNIYHCLLLHGFLIFGAPQTKSEMSNFRNRVSYLIGSRPMSLREIETVILHVPRSDPQAARQARARARQLMGVFGLCWGKLPHASRPVPRVNGDDGPDSPVSRLDEAVGQSDTLGPLCLPKMQLPKVPWASGKVQACLYLGISPESWILPKQDLRVVLTLNRGTLSCLSAIPVLTPENLEQELDCMAHQFVSTFVEVQLRDTVPERATLPMMCQGILQEFRDNERDLLAFIWNFMSKEAAQLPERKVRVKFKKFPQDARPRAQFFKAILTPKTMSSSTSFEALGSAAKAGNRMVAGSCMSLVALSQKASSDVRAGRWRLAFRRLFADLKHHGLQLDEPAATLGIKSCSASNSWVFALRVLDLARDAGAFDAVLCSAALDSCGKGLAWRDVLNVFSYIPQCGLQRNVIMANAAVSCFQRTRFWRLAAAFLQEISSKRLRLLDTTFDAATGALGAHSWKEAVFWLWKARGCGLSGSMMRINMALGAAAASSWRSGGSLLEGSEIKADVYGWTSVISGFTRASRWESASSLASQLARRRLQAHLITQNALLGGRSEGGPSGPGSAAGAGRAGRAVPASSRPWDRALQQVSIGFDVVTGCSLVSAATLAKQWASAVGFLHATRERGVLLDGIAWSAGVSALAFGSFWESSLLQAAATISAWKGLSGAITSTLLGSCTLWEVAINVLASTQHANLEPDASSDGAAAFLRSISKGSWQHSLAFAERDHEALKQASVAESMVQCLLQAGSFEALLQHLWKTRQTLCELLVKRSHEKGCVL
ncbi:unnamed protein product [Durusdinium trenchii]|uniref:DUF547 domain-containing protein n=1 Tax=Durusdinium trenchii TaxID=1381693 RepID=A0ABP0LAS9_9DINO